MVDRTRIRLNSSEMARYLKSPMVRPPLRAVAEQIARTARAEAPVDTGDYRASIHVESATTDRAVERVVADDWKAPLIEARTGNLARAMRRHA